MMRRLLPLALLLAIPMALAACGGGGGGQATVSQAGADLFAKPNEPLIDSSGRFSPDARRVLDIIELQLGLEGYRAASGRYPASLEDLIPTYAPLDDGTAWAAVPTDPDSHAAYRYTPAESGATYSLAAVMSSGKEFAVSNPPAVTAMNPDRGIRQEFVVSSGIGRLAAGNAGSVPQISAQAGSQVEVDNSQGNHASTGKVINPNPASARLGVHNLHHFWTNVTLQAPSVCCVHLAPSPFNGGDIGGLYAQLGAIAPDGDAVWDGSFDPGSAQPVLTTPSIVGGSIIAGTFNILTFVTPVFALHRATDSIQTIVSALHTAQNANDLVAATQAIEKSDVTAFVRHFYKMLSDPNQRTLIRGALEQLGFVVSEGALEQLTLVIAIVELGQKAFDEVSAVVQGTAAGEVAFSASYPPVTQGPTNAPPTTPVRPTSPPGRVSTPTPLPPGQPTVAPSPTAGSSGCGQPALGGVWVYPPPVLTITGTSGDVFFFPEFRAYVTDPAAPPVYAVQLTAWWPALGPESGPWSVLQLVGHNGDGSDDYTFPVAYSDLPLGDVLLSFDIFNTAGQQKCSPNGTRLVHHLP